MSTNATEERIMPRSALRHRPIGQQKTTELEIPCWVPRSSRRKSWPGMKRQHLSHLNPPVAKVATKRQPLTLPDHWLLFVGVGMVIAVVLVALGQVVFSWSNTVWEDLQYGRPRTFQVDVFVGHESGKQPSHFVAMNLHGRVEIIEFPGGDARKAHLFVGPQLSGQDIDRVPVTLQFVETRKDHHPDMIVLFGNTQFIYRNTKITFVPQ